jgi:hypothetical protein
MIYDGKRLEEMSNEELEAAAVYCARMKHQAANIFNLNDAALIELSEEYAKRLGCDLAPDIESSDGQTIN